MRSIRDDSYEASDSLGTLHFAHWVPFEDNHLAFFTIYDGDFAKYIQDLAEKTSALLMLSFHHIDDAPPTPVAKNAQAFYDWALDNNYPPIGFYSAYPGLGVQDIRALLLRPTIARHQRPPLGSRRHMVANHGQPRGRRSLGRTADKEHGE